MYTYIFTVKIKSASNFDYPGTWFVKNFFIFLMSMILLNLYYSQRHDYKMC